MTKPALKRIERLLTVDSMADLNRFGVVPLTGEACPYNQRVLCDVTQKGKALLEQFLNVELKAEPCNSGSNAGEHVNSLMFPRSMWIEFCDFASWQAGAKYLVIAPDKSRAYYLTLDDGAIRFFTGNGGYQFKRCPQIVGQPQSNGMNISAMHGDLNHV